MLKGLHSFSSTLYLSNQRVVILIRSLLKQTERETVWFHIPPGFLIAECTAKTQIGALLTCHWVQLR